MQVKVHHLVTKPSDGSVFTGCLGHIYNIYLADAGTGQLCPVPPHWGTTVSQRSSGTCAPLKSCAGCWHRARPHASSLPQALASAALKFGKCKHEGLLTSITWQTILGNSNAEKRHLKPVQEYSFSAHLTTLATPFTNTFEKKNSHGADSNNEKILFGPQQQLAEIQRGIQLPTCPTNIPYGSVMPYSKSKGFMSIYVLSLRHTRKEQRK